MLFVLLFSCKSTEKINVENQQHLKEVMKIALAQDTLISQQDSIIKLMSIRAEIQDETISHLKVSNDILRRLIEGCETKNKKQ